jgi:hypothetical protein
MKSTPKRSPTSEQSRKMFYVRCGLVLLFLLLAMITPPSLPSRLQALAASASAEPAQRSGLQHLVQQTAEPIHWSDPLQTFLSAYTFNYCVIAQGGRETCVWNKPGAERTQFWIEVSKFDNIAQCRAWQSVEEGLVTENSTPWLTVSSLDSLGEKAMSWLWVDTEDLKTFEMYDIKFRRNCYAVYLRSEFPPASALDNLANKIDQEILKLPQCPDDQAFKLELACTFNEAAKESALDCVATPQNPPSELFLEYYWDVDGEKLEERSNHLKLGEERIKPGNHIVHVYAQDRTYADKKSDTTNWAFFREEPADSKFIVVITGCNLRTESRSITCTADFENAPKDASGKTESIEYIWTLDDQPKGDKTSNLRIENVSIDADKTYHVAVRAKAVESGRVTKPAYLGYQVGDSAEEPSDSPFKVTIDYCDYKDTGYGGNMAVVIKCRASVHDPPKGEEIQYRWIFDGKDLSAQGKFLSKFVPKKKEVHTFSVRGATNKSGRTTQPATSQVAIGAGQASDPVEIQTPTGTQIVKPGEPVQVTLTGGKAEFKVICNQARKSLGTLSTWASQSKEGRQALKAVVELLAQCDKLGVYRLVQLAMTGWPGNGLAPYAEEAGAQLRVQVLEGPLMVEVQDENVVVNVETPTTMVRSGGKNTFGVAYDPANPSTVVETMVGPVDIWPANEEIEPLPLLEGQQVIVNPGDIGEITPASRQSLGMPRWMMPVFCLGLFCLVSIFIAAGAGVYLWQRRRSKPSF